MFFKKNHKDSDVSKSKKRVKSVLPKVLSLLAALILWFYVYDSREVDEEKVFSNIPVVFENFDEEYNLDVVSGNSHSVDIKVRGSKKDLSELSKEDFIVTADMNGIEEAGSYPLKLNFIKPSGVEIIEKSATEISVKVDKIISKNIEVDIELLYDKLDESKYDIGDLILSSSSVQVTGPMSDVEKISKLSATIKTGEIKASFKSHSSLVALDDSNNPINSPYLKMSQHNIIVTVPVYKKTLVPIEAVFKNTEYEYNYSVFPESIYIRGEVSTVDSVSSVKTLSIDAVEKMKIIKKLDLPDGVSAYDADGNPINDVQIIIHSADKKEELIEQHVVEEITDVE